MIDKQFERWKESKDEDISDQELFKKFMDESFRGSTDKEMFTKLAYEIFKLHKLIKKQSKKG